MAAELTTIKLNPESHLLLDQPLLRLPFELSRKNFKSAQRSVERAREELLTSLKSTATSTLSAPSPSDAAPQTLQDLDTMIQRMQFLKRKLQTLHTEEVAIHKQSRLRIQHLQDLYDIPSLADVKYDNWSRIRLDRLLVDYLLRSGYVESARALAMEKGIEELVDVDAFVLCHRIESALKSGDVKECLTWCGENKLALKKMECNLEYELRLQQFIELLRTCQTSKIMEAAVHARRYLASHQDPQFAIRAAGLLAFAPDTNAEPYKTMYSYDRYDYLSKLFTRTHHALYSLPPQPLLHIALSAGLSALKTPSCHSRFTSSSSNASSATTSVCPICSTELNDLARNVPYAHHTKSYVEPDPVVLPDGRIYGRERLMALNDKIGAPEGKVRDPMDVTILYDESQIKKVFIS